MAKTEQTSILEVENLTKVYGSEIKLLGKNFGRKVVGCKDVSFEVVKGEIFGFLGPNGAGKTTTIRSILDLLNIQNGTIRILGFDHRKEALEIQKHIGYVPGDVALYDNFTGNELVNYFNNFRPVNPDFLTQLKDTFKVDLSLKIKALSKGNRQQVALITALAPKPDFIIMDEPSSGLDPLMTARLHNLLKELKQEGITIFLSSHDLAEVQTVCDRVGIIKEGKMILIEEVEDLKSKFLQQIKIKFSTGSLPELQQLKKLEHVVDATTLQNGTFVLKVRGDKIKTVLEFVLQYKIKRITIENASLEDIFLQYYE